MRKIPPRILTRILPFVAVLLLPSAPALSQFAGPTLVQPSPPPAQKKAPVAQRATKACPEYGAGYMRVEGSGSCVKIGGYVRIEATR